MKYYISALLLLALCLIGCGGEKKKIAFYENEADSVDSMEYAIDDHSLDDYGPSQTSDNVVSVPFVVKGGVKYVNVSVNGFGFQMIFDTGCSRTLISVAEARYLYEKGYLTDDDFLDVEQAMIADGSIVENMVVNLKEVIIDDKIRCTDVKATVSANDNAPLLLGNEVLDRVAAYVVDNENQKIDFKLK